MSWKKEKGSIHLYSALETIGFSPNGKGRGSTTLASPQLVSNKETPWSHLFVPHSSLCFIFFTLGPYYVEIETFDSFSNPPSNEYQLLICLSSIIWILIFHHSPPHHSHPVSFGFQPWVVLQDFSLLAVHLSSVNFFMHVTSILSFLFRWQNCEQNTSH